MSTKAKQTPKFILNEQDITVRKPQTVTADLTVTTQMRSGGHWSENCFSEDCCEDKNGKWQDFACWIPIDHGTGDWD